MARAAWGLKPNILKEIYHILTEKIILYGASIWYKGYF